MINFKVEFETKMWPEAYGVSNINVNPTGAGFSMTPNELVHTSKNLHYIPGYDPPLDIKKSTITKNSIIYDFIHFISLLRDRKPNAIDVLYMDEKYILKSSEIYNKVRENRSIFTGPTIYHNYYENAIKNFNKLYLYKTPTKNSKQKIPTQFQNKKTIYHKGIDYDVELAVNAIRSMNQAYYWLEYEDNHLKDQSEMYNDILKGEFKLKDISEHFETIKRKVNNKKPDNIKINSDIQYNKIREFLKNLIEEYYGTY